MCSKHRKLDKHCLDCGIQIDDRSTHCQSCTAKNKPKKKWLCIDCGKEISKGSIRCPSCFHATRWGENHPNYKHGMCNADYQHSGERARNIVGYAIWHKEVLERDNYICQHCGSKIRVRTHHIESYKNHPELRINVNNGITLCAYHHNQLHHLFGQDVTAQQLYWFLENVK